MQTRQQALIDYCSNIYTVGPRLRVAQSFFKVNFGAPACHQPLTSCNKLANKPNRAYSLNDLSNLHIAKGCLS
jgi:hypothetical protein